MHLIYVAAVVCELAQSRHLKLADWCIIFRNSCKALKKVQNHWGEDVISFTKDVESTRKLYRYVLHYHLSSSLSHRICFALWHWNTKSSCFLVFNSFYHFSKWTTSTWMYRGQLNPLQLLTGWRLYKSWPLSLFPFQWQNFLLHWKLEEQMDNLWLLCACTVLATLQTLLWLTRLFSFIFTRKF